MRNRWRLAIVAFLVPLFLLTLSGCSGDDRKCLSDHWETTFMPVFNGKTTTLIPVTNIVCDEWEAV